MPERIVDVLEPIDVAVQQGNLLPRFLSPRDQLLHQVLELHPVRNLRQRVDLREVAYALLGDLALGNIPRRDHEAVDREVLGIDP